MPVPDDGASGQTTEATRPMLHHAAPAPSPPLAAALPLLGERASSRGPADVGAAEIRRLGPEHRPQLVAHLLRLDGETRRARFGNGVNDAFLRRYGEGAIGPRALVLGLFVGNRLRGIAELRLGPETAGEPEAEAAFSLEPAFQGLGLGGRLFEAAVTLAADLGLRRLSLSCLAENRRMQRLARRHGGRMRFLASEAMATIEAPAGAPLRPAA